MAKSTKEKIQLNPDKLLGFTHSSQDAKVGAKIGGKVGGKVGAKTGAKPARADRADEQQSAS